MIREAKEDTVLQIPNPVGQEGTTSLPVPKGVQVNISPVSDATQLTKTHYFRSLWIWLESVSEAYLHFTFYSKQRYAENNPRYFDEPEKFKPSRWYGVSGESELFSAFSIGKSINSNLLHLSM